MIIFQRIFVLGTIFHFLTFLVPKANLLKIILMYASCDDQLTYLLYLLQKSMTSHFVLDDESHSHGGIFNKEVYHVRHNLSNACMWVLQETVAVVAVTGADERWEDVEPSAHRVNMPHFVSDMRCKCRYRETMHDEEYYRLLEEAVFEFLKEEFLHDVIILLEEDNNAGTLLSKMLNAHGIRVSQIRVANRPDLLKTIERYFEAWNMMDLSDEGRLLVSLGQVQDTDNVLKNLVESNMRNKRTKLLVADDPAKWQDRLKMVLAYEVDLVVVSSSPVMLDDCPTALELLPMGSHSHKTEGSCRNLSSEHSALGEALLRDFKNFYHTDSCCPGEGELSFTFWQSWPYENGTQKLQPKAVWSSFGTLRMMPIDMQTIRLRIAVLPYRPYLLIKTKGDSVWLEDCVFKEIITFLSKRLHFEYRLLQPPDEQWGSKVDGQWDGAIGMITRGEADIVPYLASTPSRQEAVDFSKPLANVKYGMLVAFPTEPPRAFIFLKPYKREVWLLFLGTAFFLSLLLYKMHRLSCRFCRIRKKYYRGLSTFFRCFWLIFAAMLNQGGTYLPITNSARLVLASWWLAVLVIMATFSANLIAFLAFPQATWVVKDLEDLVRHKSIQLTIKRDCPVLEDFKESNTSIYKRIREVFLENSRRGNLIRVKRSSVVDDVATSKTVFIDDVNYLERMVEQDYDQKKFCRLTMAPTFFSRMELTLGLRRGSSLKTLINSEIQQMQESGILEHWRRQYSPQHDECYDFDSALYGQSEITLEDLQGPFYLLAIGLVFGFLFLGGEYLWRRAKIAYMEFLKRKMFKHECSTMYW